MTTLETGIEYKEPITLSNGVNLHLIQTGKFKTAVCCVLIRRPLSRGESTKNAVIAGILRQGCASCPSILEINSHMEELFGSVFDCQIIKKAEEQIIQVYFEGMAQGGNFIRGVEFLVNFLTNPLTDGGGFVPEIVETAKNGVKNAVEGRINNKAEYARLKCFETMCGNEPFSIYADGYMEDLPGLTPEGLYAHYMEILSSSPIEVICAGQLEESELRAAASGFCAHGRRPLDIPQAGQAPARREAKNVIEELGGSQGKICMGLRSDIDPVSDQFYALLMVNEILGGGPSSKLFMKIREGEKLCYYINSSLYRFKSIILIQSGVDANNFARVAEMTNREAEDIRQECVTRDEWASAQRSLVSKFKRGQDHFSSILDFYMAQYLLGDVKPLSGVVNSIGAVAPEAVFEAARQVRLDTVFRLK